MFKWAVLGIIFAFVAYFIFHHQPISYKDPEELNEVYDYIIVGGGTAGCVLASRLSSREGVSVLLLESGDVPPSFSFVPGYASQLHNSDIDWQIRTVPQKNACLSMIDRRSAWPRGKCLGGSSSINNMVYNRGHPADYDHWAVLLNNRNWSYKEILPYFIKSERTYIPELKLSGERGHHGPIKTSWALRTKLSRVFLEAAKAADLPIIKDYNTERNEGFSYVQQTVYHGRRQSTFQGYLKKVNNTRLHIVTKAHVTKILFKWSDAVGVEFAYNGDSSNLKKVRARRDIILSAGAIGSPQILLLSGVGPSEHLKQMNIPVVKDLPVGKYLVDHVFTDLTFSINKSIGVDHLSLNTKLGLLLAQKDYYLHKTMPLNSTVLALTGNFYSGLSDDKRPDLSINVAAGPIHSDFLPKTITNMKEKDALMAYESSRSQHSFSLVANLLHPKSTGEIRLRSTSPFEHPIIDPNYLHDDLDMEVLLSGINIIIKIVKQKPFESYNLQFSEQPIPGCKQHPFASDNYFRCHIRHRTNSGYHPTCSCRMGSSDITSVVDTSFRVHGIQKLRVVDASVFPDTITGNTCAATVVIAEKAADIILSET